MKKSILFVLLALCSVSALFAAGKSKLPQTVYVSVEKADLKESPGRFSKKAGSLEYGDVLSVLGSDGDWYEVVTASTNQRGWISTGVVTKNKIVTNHMADASADEIALAGKGFTKEIVDVYRSSNEADFDSVDRMEQVIVSDEEILQFLSEGNLMQGAF